MTVEDNYYLADEITNKYSDFETFVFLLFALKFKGFNNDIEKWEKKSYKNKKKFIEEVNKELTKLTTQTILKTSEQLKQIADIESEQIIKDLQNAGFYGKIKAVKTNKIVLNSFNNVNKYINKNVTLDLISRNQGGRLDKIYTNIVKDVVKSYVNGANSFKTSLSSVINQYINNGLQSGYIDRGGRRWQLDTYMDSVLRNEYKRAFNDVRTQGMFENGIYTVFMTTVPNCAPRCAQCQGRILDMRPIGKNASGYPSIYSFDYGLAGGTLGCNCRHMIMPYMTEKGLKNSLEAYTIEDKENYLNTQKQRYYEREARKKDRLYKVAKELNNEKDINKYGNQLKLISYKLNKVVKETSNTVRMYEREKNRYS